jgi:DNA-binding NtrC family response regulator
MIVAGTFREDLFHRLSVLEIELPPLRNRPEDISLLVRHFAARTERELGRPLRISEQALAAARKHPWPGNVRALRNALLRAGALCDGAIDGNALVPARWTDRAQDSRATDCIIVPKGDFASMKDVLLQRILHESGSMRRAAEVLGVPKSTLSNWLRQGRSRMPPSCG